MTDWLLIKWYIIDVSIQNMNTVHITIIATFKRSQISAGFNKNFDGFLKKYLFTIITLIGKGVNCDIKLFFYVL